MALQGVGQDNKVQRIEPKVENKSDLNVNAQTQSAPAEVNTTRVEERAFSATITKESLNRALNKAFEQINAAKAQPAKQPIDYFEIDKQADELIEKHTEDRFLLGDKLNTDALGQELADIAKKEPERAAALTDNILDKIDNGDKDEVAQSMVEAMSPAELREYAKTDEGKKSLEQLKGELLSGRVHDDERETGRKIDTAIKSAELEKSPEFQKLDKTTQQEILTRLENNATNEKAVDNLISLAKDGNFQKLPADTQKAILRAYDNRPEDTVFVDGMKNLAGKSEFQGLTAAQQAQVVGDLDKFANTESYKGKDGFIFGIGGREVSDASRTYLLDNIGDASIFSVQNPHEVAVRNTLDKLTSGEIRVEAYSEPSDPKTGGTTFGYTYSNDVIYLNSHPDANNDAVWGSEKFIDTLVHEVNHNQNPGGDHGTPDQFLNEYRAFYVGRDAVGETMDAGAQKDIIDNLLASYPAIKELYDENPEFKKFVDDAIAGLAKTPPETRDPEQMRQALLDAGFESDYLNTPGNLDNH